MERMRLKRRLAAVQCDVRYPHREFRTFAVRDGMNRRQGCAQLPGVDPPLRPPPLKAGLRFRHAILDGFDAIAARQRAP